MLKLAPFENSRLYNIKCGEVFYLSSTSYNVTCCQCGSSISFEDFPQHFQQEHISGLESCDTSQYKLSKLEDIVFSDAEPSPDCVKDEFVSEDEHETPAAIEDVEVEDEKPFDMSRVQWLQNEVSAADLSSAESLRMPLEEEEIAADKIQGKKQDDWVINGFSNSDDSDKKDAKDELPNFPCSQCDRAYKSKRSLGNHIRISHNPTRKQKSPSLKHKCDDCGELFRSERHLRGHKWKHTGIFCDVCGKPFTQTGNMIRHKIRHTGVKPHECKECGNTFYTDKELRAHMMRHTGILPIICEICGRRCRDHGVLTAHMRRHTGERPAKCEVCGKSFYSFHDLNVHAVTHSTERPFVCDVCGSTFQRKKSLRVHKQLHSKVRKYECKVCGKTFAQSGGLNAHMRTHDSATRKTSNSSHSTHSITISHSNVVAPIENDLQAATINTVGVDASEMINWKINIL